MVDISRIPTLDKQRQVKERDVLVKGILQRENMIQAMLSRIQTLEAKILSITQEEKDG